MNSAPDPSSKASTPPPPLRIAMLVYPMMRLLDLAGPQTALGMHGETFLVWKTAEPIQGYRTATHWAAHDALAAMGVEAVRERVVIDRNRMTGGGVTAGIDFGLPLLARLRGEDVAKATQLALEYDPAPPFVGGRPENAEPETVAMVRDMIAEMDGRTMEAAGRVGGRGAA